MSSLARTLIALIFVPLVLAGCEFEAQRLDDRSCESDGACGADEVCYLGHCVLASSVDAPEEDAEPEIFVPQDTAEIDTAIPCGDTTCTEDQECCDGSCVNLGSDLINCGACGAACDPASQLCVSGTCQCRAGFLACDGVSGCVDFLGSVESCGDCDVVCEGDGARCLQGQCADCGGRQCAAEQSCCGDVCVDTAANPQNCGVCGNVCGPNELCSDESGPYDCVCAEGFDDCDGDPSNGCEARVTSNPRACGACDVICGDGESCVDGVCTCGATTSTAGAACGSGGDVCCQDTCVAPDDSRCQCGDITEGCTSGEFCCDDTYCADLQTADDNCGACGEVCDSATSCVNGQCVCPNSGETLCDGACVTLADDDANCGACGVFCEGTSTCQQGACVCPSGEELCADGCFDLQNSTEHCGACGNSCSLGEACCDGACVDTTLSKSDCGGCGVICDGACAGGLCLCEGLSSDSGGVDLSTDDGNCGVCGNDCDRHPNTRNDGTTCVDGVCDYSCRRDRDNNEDWEDCDPSALGCETNIEEDPDNCGGCGNDCSAFPNATDGSECRNSSCRFDCQSGWDDCNRDDADGCELDVSSDVNNCGRCGNACPTDAECVDGECRCPGSSNECTRSMGNRCDGSTCRCGGGGACSGDNRCEDDEGYACGD